MHAPLAHSMSLAFLEAYQRCSERKPSLPEDKRPMFLPALINAALAAELGLKAILMSEGGSAVRSHDLLKLFNQLPVEAKLNIIYYSAYEAEAFHTRLALAKLAFEKWRYAYEEANEASVSLEFIARFATAVTRVSGGEQRAT